MWTVKRRRVMRACVLVLLASVASVALLLLHDPEEPVLAAHHIAEISEVMSGFAGDSDVQFVEVDQLASYQNFVTNTRLTAFNPDGSLAGVLLDPVGGDVSLTGDKWIMGTAAFETASGINADFVFSPGILPAAGMVCWGAPDVSAPLPNTWAASDPNNYVDCVSYGGAAFTGTNSMSPNPAGSGAGDGTLSLTRSTSSTGKITNPWRNSDDDLDFKLAVPSPTNDAGQVGSLDPPKDPNGDTDGDKIVNSLDPDDDNDGCTDVKENGKDPKLGGLRNPHNPHDFYDVLGGGGGPPDQFIDLTNDIFGVILHYAPTGTEPEYDVAFDRGPTAGPNVWNMTAPDGVIDLTNDILGVIQQYFHSCQ